jgi:predicted nucleic acid-binding Zn finger protein
VLARDDLHGTPDPTEPVLSARSETPDRDSGPRSRQSARRPEVAGVTPVEEWQAALADAGELTPDVVEQIIGVHGDRGQRAIEAVSEGRVKEYRDFTVVVGREDEYVVEDGACTCKDAEYNLDPEDPTDLCWHAIAVAIAERVGAVEHHDMWYSEVRDFL